MSAGVKDKSLNSYTIYVCTCVRCVMRGGGVNVGRCQILTSLNPLEEGELNQ